ncbi:MAG: RNA ligase family protein [Desulforhopalus sp.]
MLEAFRKKGIPEITVYGESCGGKMQGMKDTYGDVVRFVAFEVKIGKAWLNVQNASGCVGGLGLDFVAYESGPASIEWLNEQRDKPSQLAIELNLGDKMREGVVVRPVMEYRDNRGNRIITKHKRDEFMETRTKREVDPDKLEVLVNARDIAEEWVVPMRLLHILDKLPETGKMEHVPMVIRAMQADVKEESEGEVVWSKAVEKAIASLTVKLYKKHIFNDH